MTTPTLILVETSTLKLGFCVKPCGLLVNRTSACIEFCTCCQCNATAQQQTASRSSGRSRLQGCCVGGWEMEESWEGKNIRSECKQTQRGWSFTSGQVPPWGQGFHSSILSRTSTFDCLTRKEQPNRRVWRTLKLSFMETFTEEDSDLDPQVYMFSCGLSLGTPTFSCSPKTWFMDLLESLGVSVVVCPCYRLVTCPWFILIWPNSSQLAPAALRPLEGFSRLWRLELPEVQTLVPFSVQWHISYLCCMTKYRISF